MSYGRGRDYIHGNTEYRGHVRQTGERMAYEHVYDETEEEYQARRAAWIAANPGRSIHGYLGMPDPYRKQHREERGLQPYDEVRTYGPYATIGPAKRAAGTGRETFKTETRTDEHGVTHLTVRRVQVGTVEWKDAE